MIKTIYANGCSWTVGHGLHEDPALKGILKSQVSEYSWPKTLSTLMGCDHINNAEGAGSNERILRTTIDFVMNYPKDKYDELLIVIGWSTIERREAYLEHEGISGWFRFNATQPFSSHHALFSRGLRKEIDAHQKNHVALMHNGYADLTAYFQQVYLLKNLLENLGIKFIFFNSMPWVWGIRPDVEAQFKTHLQETDSPQTKGMAEQYSFFKYCQETDKPFSTCLHPLYDAHNEWAHILRARIKEVYGE